MLIKELDAPVAPFGAGALRVLAEGAAPCARTLRSLAVEHVPPEVGRPVLDAMAANAFPSLTKLSLEGDWVDNTAVDGLVQALRRLAAWWPDPCRLKELSIEGGGTAYMAHMGQPGLDTVVAAQQLTPAFVEGALSGLTRLAIRGRAAKEPYPPGAMDWVDDWAAVGPARMRLEALTLRFGDPQLYHLYTRLQEAAADPAFCPHLCKFSFQNWNDFGQPAAAIRERWRVRLARAAAAAEAAMVQAGVEGLGEYASEFVSLSEEVGEEGEGERAQGQGQLEEKEEEGKEEAVVAVVVEEQQQQEPNEMEEAGALLEISTRAQ